jgi:DNA-binding SARP family transcriptional activator
VLWLLGPPALLSPDGVRRLELRPKALALLAYLAVVEEPQPRGRLADLLFPRAANPRDSLRWYLSYLRRHVPGVFVSDRMSVSARVATDVAAFRRSAASVLDGCSLPEASETLALYRGGLCEGLVPDASAEFGNWLYVQDDELRRLFRRAAQAFAGRALAEGHGAMAIPALRRLTAVDPYFEEGHVLLVEATEASGDTASARHAYDRYQRIVRDELHAEPRRDLVAELIEVGHQHEVPRLPVLRRRRQPARLEDPRQLLLADRPGRELPHIATRPQRLPRLHARHLTTNAHAKL